MMKEFYCNECEENVELIDGKCPKCGTDWQKIIFESTSNDSEPICYIDDIYDDDNNTNIQNGNPKNTNTDDIEDTYVFFLKYASVAKVFCFILSGLFAFIAIFDAINTEEIMKFFLAVPIVMAGMFYGILFEKNLKWKAYLLQTNYKKVRKKR